jgi:hypothetical protein
MPDDITPVESAPVETPVIDPASTPVVETTPEATPQATPEHADDLADADDITEEEITAAAQIFLSQFGDTPAYEPVYEPAQPTPSVPVAENNPSQANTVAGQYVSRLDQLESHLREAWDGYEYGAPASEVAILEFLKETKDVIVGLESRVDGTQTALSPFVEQQREVAANRLVEVTSKAAEEIKAVYPNAPVDIPSLLRMVGSKFEAYAQLAGLPGDLTSIEAGAIKDMFEMSMRPHLSKFATTPKTAGNRPDAIASGSAPAVPAGLTREEQIAQDLALANQR